MPRPVKRDSCIDWPASGYCLIELMAAVAVAGALSAAATPALLATIDDSRARGAALFMSTRLYRTRTEAVSRASNVAIRFVPSGSAYGYAVYQDGNGNGVLSRDIQRGVDPEIHPLERLADQFSGVDFGALPGLPPADPDSSPPGADPIKLGSGDMVSFSPIGTSSTGTLYIRGKHNTQYAVIVFGETGKTRTLKYNQQNGEWSPI
jgi:type II secretory pathway pseudopilin PulG